VIVAASPVVLGLDYGGTKIAAAVSDLAGNQLASTTTGSGGALGAQASFARGIQVARDLLQATAPDSELAAVGVSTFGIPFEDRVELAPAIDGWGKLAMGRELRAAFAGAQIRMATDAKAAAQAEARWGVLAGRDPAIYLNLGTGLAAAVVIGGRVVNGVNGAAARSATTCARPPTSAWRSTGGRCSSTWSAARRWPSGPHSAASSSRPLMCSLPPRRTATWTA
jgi:glucokinase